MKTVYIIELFDSEGRGNTSTQRIYLAGHLSFTDHQFLFPFGILAILILAFIVFLPPLLLLGPLQLIDWLADKPKFGFIRKFWPTITIHTFLDTFEGYKPTRRFFVGLHLLFRLALFLTFSFSPNRLSHYVVQLVIIMVFLTLVSLLRPYSKEYYNHLDSLLLLNLGLLTAISIYVSERGYTNGISTLELILSLSPLIYMVCFIIYKITFKRICHRRGKEGIYQHLTNPVKSSREETEKLLESDADHRFGETGSYYYYSSDDPDEELFQRAARGNRFRKANMRTHPPKRPGGVYKTVVSIQEPEMTTGTGEKKTSSTNQNDSGIGGQDNNTGRSLSPL